MTNPAPTRGTGPLTIDLVQNDIEARGRVGVGRYGMYHQPDNGRDHLLDAYEEAMDLCIYLRAEMYKRDGR